MKYLAPVAELVSVETVSVILASPDEAPTCPENTAVEGNCPEDWGMEI